MSTKQRGATTTDVKTLGSRLEATIKRNTREIVAHFNASQGEQNKWIKGEFEKVDQRFDEIRVELEAIKEMLAMKQELRNLVRELKAKGIELDESRIFAR
ncbi:MAG: hypothetical protein HY420_03040 [Candidatus Kerfeldbacteria bacterium]|nr:hypothetical protein [Candidatus Kerfeldbacteria bacterium]